MSVRIMQGDVRIKLQELPADHFDCIVTSPPYFGLRSYLPDSHTDKHLEIGLEPTLDAYLETMVSICRELRRVLKPSGVCFINIGDSYNSSTQFNKQVGSLGCANRYHEVHETKKLAGHRGKVAGLKPKDLMLVPERLGIALQADGWFVRSRIVWSKPNPMPESCTDRPTSAHETVWMLTKSARYFWDAEAVKEESSEESGWAKQRAKGDNTWKYNDTEERIAQTGQRIETSTFGTNGTRNLRNVWTFASHPYPGAHFATFPPELAERCIKAGSSESGCCAACGAPWVRVVETEKVKHSHTPGKGGRQTTPGSETSESSCFRTGLVPRTTTIDWEPSCKCQVAVPVPARCLDPFAGAGTTGLVADRLGRDCTLIDLNTQYAEMALNRIKDDCPMFSEVAAE